ncbi:MAG TPA: sulfatase-like hydrolase/transferase [Thermoanaerobaculia bacterium]|nr:sulfatase-like hydrolase/transferase [Thermoanaerobaculia bacterium]
MVLGAFCALSSGCQAEAPAGPKKHAGPIVLITFEGLRDDAVTGLGGEPGLTPRFRALVARAWSGRGIASSGSSEASVASVVTGLAPWQHQILAPGVGELPAGVLTLAEALHGAGYRTYGFGSAREVRLGLARGFDEFGDLGKGHTAMARLSRLSGGRELVWIHLSEPRPPFVRRDWLLARLPGAPANLPRRLSGAQIEQLLAHGANDPEVLRKLGAMYRSNVAWADERLGRLLDALDSSGKRDQTLLVVTSVVGEDFGAGRFGARDGGLGRQILEVPLVVAVPGAGAERIAMPPKHLVALTRIWATVAEAAGLPVPPAVAPSLFRPSSSPILSELYAGPDGCNRFSLVAGSDQLLWQVAFASPGVSAAEREAAFAATPPLHGQGDPPVLHLLRWGPGGSRPSADPAREKQLAEALERAWNRFAPEELSLLQEARARGLAAVATPADPAASEAARK